MIDEINKLQDIVDKGRSIGTIDDEIGKELLKVSIEILDKYNNQEKVSKETQDILLNNFNREHTRATKYQSVWEELDNILKSSISSLEYGGTYKHNGVYVAYNRVLSKTQELSKKYNLDSIVERVDE